MITRRALKKALVAAAKRAPKHPLGTSTPALKPDEKVYEVVLTMRWATKLNFAEVHKEGQLGITVLFDPEWDL